MIWTPLFLLLPPPVSEIPTAAPVPVIRAAPEAAPIYVVPDLFPNPMHGRRKVLPIKDKLK